MNEARGAGSLLIVLPLAFNLCFSLLARRFDYPDILRRPTSEVLDRFRAGGARLLVLWWIFTLTAVLLALAAVLLASALVGANSSLVVLAATTGVMAAVVQFLGLVRWPFLVPYLARVDADPDASPARRETIDVVFQSFNRYLGVAVGEHLGYLLTGCLEPLDRCRSGSSHEHALVVGCRRHRDRRTPDDLLTGVRRRLRAGRLEAGRGPDPDRVCGLVPMADRRRRNTSSLMVGPTAKVG